MSRYILPFILVLFFSCQQERPDATLFVLKNSAIGIEFENNLSYTEDFNPYLYRNFYNGGGVAIGDINNDGLEDIYFTGNMVDNKLFLNKGNWQFQEITKEAGVSCADVWSTGATFVDINGDGYLDLYVCKSGPPGGVNRHNELFINNGDLTFTEASQEYGLAIEGLSVQATFFDYDKDGDLDVYILNNSIRSIGGYDLIKDQRLIPDTSGGGNKLLKNEGNKFVDITEEAGIYSSKIGFGLGVSLGDFNNDSWTDIWVSNDFFEKDYLYINDQKGGFNEALEEYFQSISMGSMGSDFADLDNDSKADLVVTEMLPETLERQKTKTIFESWDKQQLAKEQGYYNQFSRNTLQRNLGGGKFLEIGRQSNVSATEWSWSALIFDMDSDGNKDIYITNGIYKDLLDRDYLTYEANDRAVQTRIQNKEENVITKLIDAMPSQAVPNMAYWHDGDFNFKNKNEAWGLAQPSFSNGAAYGDLDNDGDLDLVVNNVNMPSFVYENTTDTLSNRNIALKLNQNNKNINALGAQITAVCGTKKYHYDNFVSRGFQSSISSRVVIGVGSNSTIDTLKVVWPDNTTTLLTNVATNQLLTISKDDHAKTLPIIKNEITELVDFSKLHPLFQFEHKENNYIDFNNERLLPQMYSNEGPALVVGDVNKDGTSDVFIGGAKNQESKLFLSETDTYITLENAFDQTSASENVNGHFIDGDNDGDLDLYICHGGRAFSPYSTDLNDSYYINDNGTFKLSKTAIVFDKPISSSIATPADYDNDGDLDIFVGERYKVNVYGEPGSGFLLENNGKGEFKTIAPEAFQNIGMITDAAWVDLNLDGRDDLVVVGEWMSVKVFINLESGFEDRSEDYNLGNSSGLWSSLHIVDIDNDGDEDLVAGNLGLNTFFEPNMRMYIADFDGNGFKEQIICKKREDAYYPIVDKDELISQMPSLKKQLLYYKDYAAATMQSVFGEEALKNAYYIDLDILSSTLFINEDGTFKKRALPKEVQYAPVYDIISDDLNNDGFKDLLLGGNQYLVKPQFGSYDASLGWVIYGSPNISNPNSNLKVRPLGIEGQIRNLEIITNNEQKILIVALNDDKTVFYKLNNE